jgi:hypothetical protein
MVFNFLSRRPNTTKRPACPRCARPKLDRKISRFAIGKGRSETSEGDEALPDIDEAKMERVMAEMAREADGMNEDDPQQMARMMRKLYDGAGLPLGEGMQEAIRRMEAGEDPDKIEEEMGDVLEEEDPLLGEGRRGVGLRGLSRKLKPPGVDETLYDL